MRMVDDGSTSPTLLREVADWRNHPAWGSFRDRYDPLLRGWCHDFGIDANAIDEICQRIWIELAERMKTFQYDPSRRFRGWLRRLCESRVIDFVRQRQSAVLLLSLDDRDEKQLARMRQPATDHLGADGMDAEGNVSCDPLRLFLLDESERVQAAVKAKVKPHNWEAFWLVGVCDWSVERAAETLGMTHTAVYAARQRVARMLCEEGRRVSAR